MSSPKRHHIWRPFTHRCCAGAALVSYLLAVLGFPLPVGSLKGRSQTAPCPSDTAAGRMPGVPDAGTNYVANVGSGIVGFGLIATGDGLFTQLRGPAPSPAWALEEYSNPCWWKAD